MLLFSKMFFLYTKARLVSNIGGNTLKQAVSFALDRLLTVECQALINWEGREKKGCEKKYGLGTTKLPVAIYGKKLNFISLTPIIFNLPRGCVEELPACN